MVFCDNYMKYFYTLNQISLIRKELKKLGILDNFETNILLAITYYVKDN
jgi:hypothetical protein